MSSDLVYPSHRTMFPNELLYNVLLRVVATSIHTICVSPDDVAWEMNVLPTLCRVSYNFRAITLQLTKRAFQAKAEESISSIFPPITKQLERLRLFGLRLHRPSRSNAYFEPLPEDSLLIFGYSLFVAAMNLRHNSTEAAPPAFQTTQEIIISALSTSLLICPKVEPLGMADVLSDAMRKEMDLVRSGLDIVQASVELDRLMKQPERPEDSGEEDIDAKRLEKLIRIREQIGKIELAEEIYASVIESDQVFIPAKLPGVIPVLKRLRDFEDSEPLITQRIDTLLEKGSAFSPFRGTSS
ncbi:hypothetical protein D9615_007654 [Tricholomella constricta]|uniref:Uncharacterized protein n=1 Tax=Tricholomella constricta TaxID=117010 RepID=A0A8H5M0H7_9AGAR|nr:hypothetical protein D9615_007654 [Tricholomella constricta]